MSIPRAEHPNPQWERKKWRNLNGIWEFEFDFSCSAEARKLWEKESFDQEILVPFCPESSLSGIGYKDFINGVAYRRKFTLCEQETHGRTILHFGAVDYEATVYVNGQRVGKHKGGYTSFSFDITKYVTVGENTIFLAVKDDTRSSLQPVGKQSLLYNNVTCHYTRTTGIWQTVWLEFAPVNYIKCAKYYPDIDNACLSLEGIVEGKGTLRLIAQWDGKTVGEKTLMVNHGSFCTQLDLTEVHLWEAGKGGLYDLYITFGEDQVKSYFGLRSTGFEGKKFMLNGKSLFQRFVGDQGFYPEGVYTAPTEADLIKDIEISFAAGFNGARLHQKVFEPLFLYHCDRLGYMVWHEFPNWGVQHSHHLATEIILNEWSEAVERDFNHPSIIGWCPFNESWEYFEGVDRIPHNNTKRDKNALISSIYKLTKRLDPTRPCIDCSGMHRVISEVYDIHDYDCNPETFKSRWDTFCRLIRENGDCLPADHPFFKPAGREGLDGYAPFFSQPYDGQPIFISEYGGNRWIDHSIQGWGYGDELTTAEEFFARHKEITETMLNNGDIFGFCYFQLYDTEQEVNGIYTFERKCKFDVNIIKEVNSQKAKIEE